MSAQWSQSNITIHHADSLPPQIQGPETGKLSFKVMSCRMLDGAQPVGAKMRLVWWGHTSPVILKVPWKLGSGGEEILFPLKADFRAVKEYMDDMSEMNVEFLDAKNKCFGKAAIPLSKFARSDLEEVGPVDILKPLAPGSHKRVIGQLKLRMRANFYPSTNVNSETNGGSSSSSSSGGVGGDRSNDGSSGDGDIPKQGQVPQMADKSPVRPSIKDGARKVQIEPSAKGVLSSFQKNEALVHTDNSDKFSEWPSSGSKGGEEKGADRIQPKHRKGIDNNAKDVTFVPAEASGLGAAPVPMGLSRPVRPKVIPQNKSKKNDGRPSSVTSPSHDTHSIAENTPKRPAVASSVRGAAARRRESSIKGSKDSTRQKARSPRETMHVNDLLDEMAGLNDEPEPPPVQESYLDSVLRKAEGLLKTVEDASAMSRKESSWSATEEKLVGKAQFKGKPRGEDMIGQISPEELGKYFEDQERKENAGSNIDWLVEGVPEVYDEGVEFDDEALQRIMKEAGPPPSQMLFPSFFETAQKVMERLQQIRRMNVSFRNIVIHSPRYGVRKDGAFLVVKAPAGVAIEGGKLSSQLALNEFRSRAITKKDKRVGVLDDYFSGKEDLVFKQVSWPCKLSDESVRRWISGEDDGCLHIELHSFLSSNSKKHGSSDSSLFGYAKIPLGSILTSNMFDAIVNAEILADQETAAIFTNRIQSMPNGAQLRLLKPLGTSMGLITMRVALSTDEKAPEEFDYIRPRSKFEAKNLPSIVKNDFNTILAAPATESEDNVARYGAGSWTHESISQGEKSLDAARNFVPKEAREATMEDQSMESEEAYKDIVEGTYLTGNAAIVVHTVRIDKENFMEEASKWCVKKNEATKSTECNYSELQCHVCYKVADSEGTQRSFRETMASRSAVLNDEFDTVDIPIFDANMYRTQNIERWKPPLFEVWLSEETAGCQVLLGIGKHEGEFVTRGSMPLKIEIENIFTGNVIGRLDVSFILGRKSTVVDASVNSVLMDRKFSWPSHGEVYISELPLPPPMPQISEKGPIAEIPWERPQLTEPAAQVPSPTRSPLLDQSCDPLFEAADVVGDDIVSDSVASWHRMAYGGKTPDITAPEASLSPPRSLNKTTNGVQMATMPSAKDITDEIKEVRRSVNASSVDLSYDIHTFDMVVTGNCLDTVNKYFPQEAANIPGCRLIYSLDKSLASIGIHEENSEEGSVDRGLWWDKETSVGNSRRRHLLKVPRAAVRSFESMHERLGVEFALHVLNEEGDIRDITAPLGIFHLPHADLFDILNVSCNGRLVPLVASNVEEEHLKIVLDVSHRVEPSIMRQSVQSSEVHTSSSVRYSVSSIDKPNSISSSIPIEVQQPLLDFRPREAIEFDVVVEEARGILDSERKPDTLLAFCGCSAGYMQDMDSLTYSVGPESCITSVIPFDKNVLSWKDSVSNIRIPLLSTSDRKSLVKSLALKVSVYFRSKLCSFSELPEEAFGRNYQVGDQFVCSAVVDLSLLASGFPEICGWYDLKDSFQKTRGQVKIKIKFSNTDEGLELSFNSASSYSTKSAGTDNHDRSNYESSPDSRRGGDNGSNKPPMMPDPPNGSSLDHDKITRTGDIMNSEKGKDESSLEDKDENDVADREAIDLASVLNSSTSTRHSESNATTPIPDSSYSGSVFSPDGLDQNSQASTKTGLRVNETKVDDASENEHLNISVLTEDSVGNVRIDSLKSESSSDGKEKKLPASQVESSPFAPPPPPPMADPAEESLYSSYDDSQSTGTDSVLNLLDDSAMSNSVVSMLDSYLTFEIERKPTSSESPATSHQQQIIDVSESRPHIPPTPTAPITPTSPNRAKKTIEADSPFSPFPTSGIAMVDIADVLSPARTSSDAEDGGSEGYIPILSTSRTDNHCPDLSNETDFSNIEGPAILSPTAETKLNSTFEPINSSVDQGEAEPLNSCPFKAYSGTGHSAETQPLYPKELPIRSMESDVFRASSSSCSSSSSSSTYSSSRSYKSSSPVSNSSSTPSSSTLSSSHSKDPNVEENESSIGELADSGISTAPHNSNSGGSHEKKVAIPAEVSDESSVAELKDVDRVIEGDKLHEDTREVEEQVTELSNNSSSLRVSVVVTNVLGDELMAQPTSDAPFAHYISPSASSTSSADMTVLETGDEKENINDNTKSEEINHAMNTSASTEENRSEVTSQIAVDISRDEQGSSNPEGIFFLTSPTERSGWDENSTSSSAEFSNTFTASKDDKTRTSTASTNTSADDEEDSIVSTEDVVVSDSAHTKVKAVVDPSKIESIVATPLAAVVAAAREAREARERAGAPRASTVIGDMEHNIPSSPWISDKRVNAIMDQAFLIDGCSEENGDNFCAVSDNDKELSQKATDESVDNAQEIVVEHGEVVGSPEPSLTGRGLGLSLVQPQVLNMQPCNDENQNPLEPPVSQNIRQDIGEELQKLGNATNRSNIDSQNTFQVESFHEEPTKLSRQTSTSGLISSEDSNKMSSTSTSTSLDYRSNSKSAPPRILKRKPPIFPGRRKIFVDQETERVSRIMMGSFHEYANNK